MMSGLFTIPGAMPGLQGITLPRMNGRILSRKGIGGQPSPKFPRMVITSGWLRKAMGLKDTIYYYHIGLYAYRTNFLYELETLPDTKLQQLEDLEQLKVLEHGYKIKVAKVKDIPIGVDVLEDIKEVQKIL